MAKTGSVMVGIGAIIAVIVAIAMRGPGWRSVGSALSRLARSEDDHPQWELLMQ